MGADIYISITLRKQTLNRRHINCAQDSEKGAPSRDVITVYLQTIRSARSSGTPGNLHFDVTIYGRVPAVNPVSGACTNAGKPELETVEDKI